MSLIYTGQSFVSLIVGQDQGDTTLGFQTVDSKLMSNIKEWNLRKKCVPQHSLQNRQVMYNTHACAAYAY